MPKTPQTLLDDRRPWMLKAWKGRRHVDTSKAPEWWLSAPGEVEAFLRSLKGVTVHEIGHSAGGRPILAATWGERQDLPGRTSLSLASAMAAGSPEAFYGKGTRDRQGFLFLGAIHGTEIEGTVAALNFLNVVVTGKDLRGRRRRRLAEEGRRLRIAIVPFLNVDGRARFSRCRHFIGVHPDGFELVNMGRRKDGAALKWPQCKAYCPIPLEETDLLGSFYNDAGWELAYDMGFTQPEMVALRDFLREEMPDVVINSHTDNGSLVQPPGSFVPEHFRQRQAQFGSVVGMRCRRERMKKHRIPTRTQPYGRPRMAEADMIYHLCGALPLVVEFPCGYQNEPDNPDDILDIGMLVLEEVIAFGNAYGFRPPET